MKRWNDFLDSLSTGGGAIFALMVFVLIWGGVCLHIMHAKTYSEQMITTYTGLLTGFAGALLAALSARSKPLNGNTSVHTEAVTQTVIDKPKEEA